MNESLKQRIVGAFVLVAMAIVVVALVFDFSGDRTVNTQSQIPVMPEIQPAIVSQPVRPENITPAKPDEEMFQFGQDTDSQGESLEEEAPSLSSDGVPVSWVLQVGSFRDKTAANDLVNSLLKDDYRAFIREKKDSKGTLSRVFVGPKVLKKKLVQEKSAIDKKYGVDSLLIRFEP